jgi:pimeloyl-ACP methyl ester carboxylesterase
MPPLQQQMPLHDHSIQALRSVPVVFIPGIITPAAITFGPLVEVLGPQIRPVLVDYVLYAADMPPSNYHLNLELENIERTAKNAALDGFHLVGYSSGGIIALAFAARCPERVLSLALCEPGWVWNEKCSDEEVAWRDGWLEIDASKAGQPTAFMDGQETRRARYGISVLRLSLRLGTAQRLSKACLRRLRELE